MAADGLPVALLHTLSFEGLSDFEQSAQAEK